MRININLYTLVTHLRERFHAKRMFVMNATRDWFIILGIAGLLFCGVGYYAWDMFNSIADIERAGEITPGLAPTPIQKKDMEDVVGAIQERAKAFEMLQRTPTLLPSPSR